MKSTLIGLFLVVAYLPSFTQDTLKITLQETETLFLKNNAILLAQKYNIEATKAQIIQAKLWDNPTFSGEQQLYNQQTEVPIPLGNMGQRAFQIQQLFLLANKRNKRINIEKINVEASEYAYYDLMRTLSVDLRTNFYDVYFLGKSLKMFEEEINTLRQLVGAYQDQYTKGNIPLKEVIRLQSFLFTLEKEQSEYKRQVIDRQAVLKTLVNEKSNIFIDPKIDKALIDSLQIGSFSSDKLINTALENRYDLKIQEAGIRLEQANLSLQKALSTPDIRIGYSYDRNGSYIPHYHAITLSIDLPILNKNQGNIKTAEQRIEASRKYFEQGQNSLQHEIVRAYANLQENDRLFKSFDSQFIGNFNILIEGVISSYQKRNISLLEFVDFFESYKNSVLQMNSLQNDRMRSVEELNFVVGKKVL